MYLYVLFLCQLLSLTGASESGIIGGGKAKSHSRRYMVSVQAKGGVHVCGGMLIRKDFVLTSAHCLEYPLMVALGANNIKKKEKCQQKIQVAHYHRHPKHLNIKDLNYDIMLLKLHANAKLNEFVEVIELQAKDVEIRANMKCSVAGWGMMRSNSEAVDILREAEVNVEESSTCKSRWQQYFDLKQMICTRTEEGQGFCQGDSGGPLVCKNKAYGVVAYNNKEKCDDVGLPHVYMKIPFFMPWITEVLNGYGVNLSNNV